MTQPASTSEMRAAYAPYLCEPGLMEAVDFPGVGRTWALLVASPTVPAWEAFASVMTGHGYLFRESAGGTYNCRTISGTDEYSLHAYGLALDLNPSKNPHGTDTTDMPKAFRDDLEAIVTVSGRQVFQWGGGWSGSSSDPMHWQVGATPSEIATGIIYHQEEDMPLNPDDLDAIRKIVASEINAVLAYDDDKTSKVSRNVWQHGGVFKESKGDDDNAQRTLERVHDSTR